MREPRDGWTLDSEGSSREAEDTYAARRKRERLDEAARAAKASGITRALRSNERGRA